MPYYAVAKGHRPGIYRKWSDCEKQVRGFPNNQFRKRYCYMDAKRFLIRQGIRPQYDCGDFGENVDRTKNFYYAVAIGRNPGIYHTPWTGCKDEVMCFSRREYRKYYCHLDARSFMERRCPLDEYDEYSDDDS